MRKAKRKGEIKVYFFTQLDHGGIYYTRENFGIAIDGFMFYRF